jgi:hypothetical protein
MTDPFDVESHPEVLVNISTGMHATNEVQASLPKAADTGQKQMEYFIKGTLSTGEERSFYSPITQSGVKTFADMTKKTKFKSSKGGIAVATMSPEVVFR